MHTLYDRQSYYLSMHELILSIFLRLLSSHGINWSKFSDENFTYQRQLGCGPTAFL